MFCIKIMRKPSITSNMAFCWIHWNQLAKEETFSTGYKLIYQGESNRSGLVNIYLTGQVSRAVYPRAQCWVRYYFLYVYTFDSPSGYEYSLFRLDESICISAFADDTKLFCNPNLGVDSLMNCLCDKQKER